MFPKGSYRYSTRVVGDLVVVRGGIIFEESRRGDRRKCRLGWVWRVHLTAGVPGFA